MNRGSMSKQISTAPKSKSKKVKKMQFGGMAMASSPEAMQAMSQRPLQPGETRISATPGAPAGSQMDQAAATAQMIAQKQAMQATQGRPGMGDMPMPRVGLPGKPGMPPKPGMGDMPRIGLPGGPAPMPGPALRGGPGMPGSVLRGGPAPMPAMAMAKGGKAKKMAKGGKIDGCCMKGHTKGTMR